VPPIRTFVFCALWLMHYRTIYSLDRRSQLMCSTSRIISSSSYAGRTLCADDSRPGDGDEENLMTPPPSSHTPQEASANDLDWDEDELVALAYPSIQQHVHTFDESHAEAEATTSTTHMRVDERTPLLPRMTEDAEQLESTSPRYCQNSIAVKSPIVGQSTFRQTVSY
jgi:hypothetical protein